jgi:hypothetical protein
VPLSPPELLELLELPELLDAEPLFDELPFEDEGLLAPLEVLWPELEWAAVVACAEPGSA